MRWFYDFHVHTSNYSSCGRSYAEAMCRKAIASGLHGIALTEHDVWWSTKEHQRLVEQFPGLTIFQGIELTRAEGDFLTFLPEPKEGNVLNSSNIFQN